MTIIGTLPQTLPSFLKRKKGERRTEKELLYVRVEKTQYSSLKIISFSPREFNPPSATSLS